MASGKILIVDDNKNALRALNLLLQFEFETVVTLSSPNQIISELRKTDFDLVLLDMNFSAGVSTGNEGLFWLKEIKTHSPSTEVVMITAYGDVELAVKALKQGAADFTIKPWSNEKLVATLHSVYKLSAKNKEIDELRQREQGLRNELSAGPRDMIGESPKIRKIRETIDKVAGTDVSILITGENGTGKELVAREIHQKSARSRELMVTIDMGAVPETLFESELFGHKKGAFTGALSDRVGKFQLAHKGTLFLDEIGNLPPALQSKMLVTLENRMVVPIGSNTTVKIDIRLISATNANPDNLVLSGAFREDLLYRLNTIHIEVPPLRERGEDIELLASYFLKLFEKKYQKSSLRISSQAIKKLSRYPWPGNIRELKHTIEKAVILSSSGTLNADDFLFRPSAKIIKDGSLTIDEMERQMIEAALDKHDGNLTAAAEQLGVTRQTLYNKMKRYGAES